MNVSQVVEAVMRELQGPVSKEVVRGTRHAVRTVVKGTSPIKNAIGMSELRGYRAGLVEKPRLVNSAAQSQLEAFPQGRNSFFRTPGMMERTAELADAIRLQKDKSLSERAFLKAQQYLGASEEQTAMIPLMNRLANQAESVENVPRVYWQGEIGDATDKAYAAKVHAYHGGNPSGVPDSTSFLDRLFSEKQLTPMPWEEPQPDFMVRRDGYVDRVPRSVTRGNYSVDNSLATASGPYKGRRLFYEQLVRAPEQFDDGKAAQDVVSGAPVVLPEPKMQPPWRSPDEMAQARHAYIRSLSPTKYPEVFSPVPAGAEAAEKWPFQPNSTGVGPLPGFKFGDQPIPDPVNALTEKIFRRPPQPNTPRVMSPIRGNDSPTGPMSYAYGNDVALGSMPKSEDPLDEIKRLIQEIEEYKKRGGKK